MRRLRVYCCQVTLVTGGGVVAKVMKSILNVGQKNTRLFYHLKNVGFFFVPAGISCRKLPRLLARTTASDLALLQERVDYYFRLNQPFALTDDAIPVRFNLFAKQRNYLMDLYEYTRCFDAGLRWNYLFGDTVEVPVRSTLVKSRPLGIDNHLAILFKLNKIRHFVFVKDQLPYRRKRNQLVWRGHAFQENRKQFLSRYFLHPSCDVGHAHKRKKVPTWQKNYLSLREQLNYKFVLSLEGNDVASNLKWIMSSQSLCFMTRPRHETWFMEGTLLPDHHYVLIRDDFADVEEKIDYYAANEDAAEEIIRNAQAHVARFKNRDQEDLVALMVLKKFAVLSGQAA